ncbi:MAG: AMP-binding protein [Deltaproteobacteria bacterium]|nr:AMP-binding protein [Deltaproteobacteria bacterium]
MSSKIQDQLDKRGGLSQFRFVNKNGKLVVQKELREIVEGAKKVAVHLQNEGLRPNDKVILIYPASLDFVEAFLGCLIAGIIPCTIMPPDPRGYDLSFLNHVLENSKAKRILTNKEYRKYQRWGMLNQLSKMKLKSKWPHIPWVITDTLKNDTSGFIFHEPDKNDLAFLQYTSGSTSAPKGVRITHGNLSHQLQFIRNNVKMTESSEIGMWVPHYHDFGLNVAILGALWGNGNITMTSPLFFLQRPELWIEILSQFKCTHTPSPNFGLDLAVKKTNKKNLGKYDLSHLEMIALGGEQINAETVDRFFNTFKECGLQASALSGCYGLAEHVAGVTNNGGSRIEVDPQQLHQKRMVVPPLGKDAKTLIGCGPVMGDIRVKIADSETHQILGEGQVGEIFVDSPSKADGFEGEEHSESVFQNRLVPDDGYRYLKTGDLGTIVNGHLYVVGRLKELIIVNGKNYYPTDIEDAARYANPHIRPGGIAAFAAANEASETIVLFVELKHKLDELGLSNVARDIRHEINASVPGATIHSIILGTRGLVPKTSSGKVQRMKCQKMYNEGIEKHSAFMTIDTGLVLSENQKSESVNISTDHNFSVFLNIIESVLGHPLSRSSLKNSPSDLGIDSIGLMEIVERVEEETGVNIDSSLIGQSKSLIDLAKNLGIIEQNQNSSNTTLFTRKIELASVQNFNVKSVGKIEFVNIDSREFEDNIDTQFLMNNDNLQTTLLVVKCSKASAIDLIESCRQKMVNKLRGNLYVYLLDSETKSPSELSLNQSALIGFFQGFAEENKKLRLYIRTGNHVSQIMSDKFWSNLNYLSLFENDSYVSILEAESFEKSSEESWGGNAVFWGSDGELLRSSILNLVNDFGVESLYLPAIEYSTKSHKLFKELESADVKIRYDRKAIKTDKKTWLVGIAQNSRKCPALRQTKNRIKNIMADGPGLIDQIYYWINSHKTSDYQAIIFCDKVSYFPNANTSAWMASCLAMEAKVNRLSLDGVNIKMISLGPREGIDSPRLLRDLNKKWKINFMSSEVSREDFKHIVDSLHPINYLFSTRLKRLELFHED